jgi:hypothetical protein
MIALAYYFAMHLGGGISVGMFVYVVHKSAQVLLTVSAVLFAVFNVFVMARHLAWATSFVGTGDVRFGGMLIASLVFWFDQPKLTKQERKHDANRHRQEPKGNLAVENRWDEKAGLGAGRLSQDIARSVRTRERSHGFNTILLHLLSISFGTVRHRVHWLMHVHPARKRCGEAVCECVLGTIRGKN